MRVKWLPKAVESLSQVTEYIREASPKAAERVVSRIYQSTELLSLAPYLAPISKDFPKYRELIIARYPFVVWYWVDEDKRVVEIRLVWHAAQDRNQAI